MKYQNIPEEELKNKVGNDFFGDFDYTEIKGKIDFAVKPKNLGENLFEDEYYLWAEAKAAPTDPMIMLTQLVLTVGKAKTFDLFNPPHFLGCFDREKIAFVPYYDVQKIFAMNDFNWNVAPSNRETKEFKLVHSRIEATLTGDHTYTFNFAEDENDLKEFIWNNFVVGKGDVTKKRINKNNFKWVYDKWVQEVMPSINVRWDNVKKIGVIDGDFYLADLLSRENMSIKEKLNVLLKSNIYKYNRQTDELGDLFREADFCDGQKAHTQFWAKYERPPKEEYWDYMIDRRDLLVPQDIRERKGSFYTPQIWVELSQRYLAEVFGEDWQEEYYIWDCAAGTGNLLAGLTDKYNIWASTLDKADVDVMYDRIENGANLLKDHCFQFDFLNDDFEKLPKGLREIINDEERRKKLIVYINPPYAEIAGNKIGVNLSKIHDKYHSQLADANRELFAQFLIRIYNEIPNCKIGEFSKLKTLSGSHFKKFRDNFKAKLTKAFIVPAYTFDNVKGRFPIGFKIWNTEIKDMFKKVTVDIFDENGDKIGRKGFYSYDGFDYFSKWVNSFKLNSEPVVPLGWLEGVTRNDFQSQNGIIVLNKKEQIAVPRGIKICDNNLMECCVCFAVRKVISAGWLNDRDQFLYPNDGWKTDKEFQNDCLAYTLFNNNIQSALGVNHWIPFAEKEVNAGDKYDSHFMLSFIGGKIIQNGYSDLFKQQADKWCIKRKFSPAATSVFDAGRELWKYYHSRPKVNVNASFYDIREYFQGRKANGNMNPKSADEKYNELIGTLRDKLKVLAKKIEPKVYEYGFLKA